MNEINHKKTKKMKTKRIFLGLIAMATALISASAQQFQLNSTGYFTNQGVDVMAFNDFYTEGHQGGISILMNGHRDLTGRTTKSK